MQQDKERQNLIHLLISKLKSARQLKSRLLAYNMYIHVVNTITVHCNNVTNYFKFKV